MNILIALLIILLSPLILISAFITISIIIGLIICAFELVKETAKGIQNLMGKWTKQ